MVTATASRTPLKTVKEILELGKLASASISRPVMLSTIAQSKVVVWKQLHLSAAVQLWTASATRVQPKTVAWRLTTTIMLPEAGLQMVKGAPPQARETKPMASRTANTRIWIHTKRQPARWPCRETTLTFKSRRKTGGPSRRRTTNIIASTAAVPFWLMKTSRRPWRLLALWLWRKRLTCICSPWATKKRNFLRTLSAPSSRQVTSIWLTPKVTRC